MRLIVAVALAVLAITCGTLFQYKPYHTYEIGYGDQHPLDHRESAYSSITWMVSDDDNFQQLKFFDKVEGGICLRPTWDDLIALAQKEPSLRHLVPDPASRPKPMAGAPGPPPPPPAPPVARAAPTGHTPGCPIPAPSPIRRTSACSPSACCSTTN
jgi:hypothetical protein